MSTTVYSRTGLVLHRTWTAQLSHATTVQYKPSGRCRGFVYDSTLSIARCVCGWSAYGETRPDAQHRARQHRNRLAGMVTFRPGWAADQGTRNTITTATAIRVDDDRRRTAWAIAECTDPTADGSLAIRRACQAAVDRSVLTNPTAAVHQVACREPGHGPEVSMLVAEPVAESAGGGVSIAWVGAMTAWSWDGHVLTALAPNQPSCPGTANDRRQSLGHVRTTDTYHRVILANSTVSHTVPVRAIARAARIFTHPQAVADRLLLAARFHGATAGTAVLVADLIPQQ